MRPGRDRDAIEGDEQDQGEAAVDRSCLLGARHLPPATGVAGWNHARERAADVLSEASVVPDACAEVDLP